MSVSRPLPDLPNLEFERKEAKELLRRLRNADDDALSRAHRSHAALATIAPADFRLADAQLTIAREYGFASWPRLVRYFGTAARQRFRRHSNPGSPEGAAYYATKLLTSHAKRQVRAGRTLAEYVPRLFGMTLDEVFAETVTEEEARHAFARDAGFPTWAALVEKSAEAKADDEMQWGDAWKVDVSQMVYGVMRSADLALLQRVVADHPELLRTKDHLRARNAGLVNSALGCESLIGHRAMQPILQWLASQGFDIQQYRNEQLCGSSFRTVSDVQSMLDRGADANWSAPNGISVLEHALIRYGNGACVDLIVSRTTPPKALWIAAGLGDVKTVAGFLDRHGKPTAAARTHRPDFTAVGPLSWPSRTDATDDEVLFEAFFVAACNGRTEVLDYLVSRGFDVNSLAWDIPIVAYVAERRLLDVLAFLIRHGADVDLPGGHGYSARTIVTEMMQRMPWDADARGAAELCGIDVEALLAERRARPTPSLETSPELLTVLTLASDDARRLGLHVVGVENLVFGLMRVGGSPMYWIARNSGVDFQAFRDAVYDRVRLGQEYREGASLELDVDARSAVDAAVAFAAERHDETAHGMHLLAVMNRSGGALAHLLTRFGGSTTQLQETLENMLQYDNAV
ncbi:MAG: hypothetical protein H7099_14320 [Gemmatimonadaceae bacterium]|nr:hypothetical protein [Gemmatimonadaceae bacterium]